MTKNSVVMSSPTTMTNAKILVVEDELIVAENIARHLKKQGYEVVSIVDSGEAAIANAAQLHPDVILMDIMLQGTIDGIATAEQIHRQLDIPIIYMTAYADDATLKRAKQTCPYGYLVKPFKPHDLKVSIEVALQRYQQDTGIRAHYVNQLEAQKTELNRILNRDPVTHLISYQSLQEHFDHLVRQVDQVERQASYQASASQLITIIFLSLDRFDRIKNHIGQDLSDRLLRFTAAQITAELRSNDMVARIDANEFAVLLHPIEQRHEAMKVAQRILQAIAQPIQIGGRDFLLTASAGIGIYHRDGTQLDSLLQSSRTVVQQLQIDGGNRCGFNLHPFYRVSQDQPDPLTLEIDLHYALKHQELSLVYQPRVSLQSGKIVGAEALLRWHHPKHGTISPAQFIPLAESTGLIEPIGEWVLETACRQLQSWKQAGFTPLQLAVNLSGYQLRRPHLYQRLTQLFLTTAIDPAALELELTESVLIEDFNQAAQRLQKLKMLGVKIAIDDFGTGYSSLSHLHRLPFDTLKLDRSFVRHIHTNAKNKAIADAIISMAHQLKLTVIAEGVETSEELRWLHQHHCDEFQGYLFSQPISLQSFEALVQKNQGIGLSPEHKLAKA